MADRYCDYITIYELKGEIYDPFTDDDNIQHTVVYDGECKSSLAHFRGNRSIPDDENYTITIPDPTLTNINIRNVAILRTNCDYSDTIKLTIVEVKRYERNTVIHALAIKDGDTEDLTKTM